MSVNLLQSNQGCIIGLCKQLRCNWGKPYDWPLEASVGSWPLAMAVVASVPLKETLILAKPRVQSDQMARRAHGERLPLASCRLLERLGVERLLILGFDFRPRIIMQCGSAKQR